MHQRSLAQDMHLSSLNPTGVYLRRMHLKTSLPQNGVFYTPDLLLWVSVYYRAYHSPQLSMSLILGS